MEFDAGPGVTSEDQLKALVSFFRARRGPAKAFRFRDPYDFSSNGMTETPTAADQHLGIGDGQQTVFQLVKFYGEGDEQQRREITRPDPASVVISIDGQPTTNWILNEVGEISFDVPPAGGASVTGGFLFDVPVRFADDRLTANHATFLAGEIPEVRLVEVKETA